MGGEEKDSRSTTPYGIGKQPLKRENVSEAVISKLLRDFTSAELFPQSADPSQSKAISNNNDCSLNEIVTSLKHLHVRRLSQKKRRRAKKRSQHKKNSACLLNLAIAAGNFQKPIVWPAKLNCDCKKPKNTSLLNPSRLKINRDHTGNPSDSSFGSCCENMSPNASNCFCKVEFYKKHKTTRFQSCASTFGNTSAMSGLSFRSLCHQQSVSSKVKKEAVAENKGEASDCPCTDCGTYSHVYSHHFAGQQLFSNNPLMPLLPSSSSSSSDPSSCTGATHHSQLLGNGCTAPNLVPSPASTLFVQDSSSSRLVSQPLSAPTQPATSASSATGFGRSCSQEVREMEDTNVNELASYLEDLLHIPRKMSTMAEMMYA